MPHARVKEWAIALSLANLLFIQEWAVRLKHSNLYFLGAAAVTPYLIALMLNVLLLAVLFLGGLTLARRSGSTGALRLSRWVFLSLLIIPLNGIRTTAEVNIAELFATHQQATVATACIVTGIAAFGLLHWHRRITRLAAVVMLMLSPFALFTFSQAGWLLIKPATEMKAAAQPPYTAGAASQRILWIIFDTMDQRVTFTERPLSVNLPELDRLRSQSLYATHAISPNRATLRSLPALTTGQHVTAAHVIDPRMLAITLRETGESVDWSSQPTVFSAARAAGYNTAVAGRSYHPYCELFGYITTCRHQLPRENIRFRESRGAEILLAMAQQVYGLQPWWGLLPPNARTRFFTEGQRAMKVFQKTLDNTKQFAQDPRLGLIFAHFNVPHDPYFYERRSGNFVRPHIRPEGYFDNLVLADRALGEIRAAMIAAGTWEKTALIVSSDHHWQGSLEYDGRVSERSVPFLLKLPGQQEEIIYEQQFNTVLTHDLILAILNDEIPDAGTAVRWLDEWR